MRWDGWKSSRRAQGTAVLCIFCTLSAILALAVPGPPMPPPARSAPDGHGIEEAPGAPPVEPIISETAAPPPASRVPAAPREKGHLGPRELTAREITAVRLLRRFALLQASFVEGGLVDADGDGRGEHAFISDFASEGLLKAGMRPEADGTLRYEGYVYRVSLPGDGGAATDDRRVVDPDLAEKWWVLYAWPETLCDEARITFSIGMSGDVTRAAQERYSAESPPDPDAALLGLAKKAGVLDNHAAIGIQGNDGVEWFQCNDGAVPMPFGEDDGSSVGESPR